MITRQTLKKAIYVFSASMTLCAVLAYHTTQVEGVETLQAAPVTQDNLLKNGDFSETISNNMWTGGTGAKDWNVWVDSKYKNVTYTIGVENNHLKISSTDEFRVAVYQEVSIDPTKKYQLSFKVKTTNKTGVARARIQAGTGDSKVLTVSENTSGTTDWKDVTVDFMPPANVDKAKVELFYEPGTGEVLFSNLAFKEVVPEKVVDTPATLEEKVSVPLNKKYLFNVKDYRYVTDNASVVDVINGLLIPKQEGTANIKVYQDNTLLKTIPATVSPSVEDDYTKRLQEWNDIIAGNQFYDPSNEQMKALNDELEKNVEKSIADLSTEPNRTFLWAKHGDYTKSANLTATYRKLEEMAKQITNPHSKYYQDGHLVRIVKESLDWLDKHVYNESKSIVGNWWDYEIGTPRAINNTLSLMNDYFSDEEIRHYTDVIEKFVPDSNYFRKTTNNPFEALGGNLVDMGRVKIIAGLLRKDDAEISSTSKSIEKVFRIVTSGEGFYPDGSYIDHTNVAYTGAYGSVLIDGLSQLLPIIQKTKSPLPTDKMTTMYQWIDRSFVPLIVHGELMDLSRGRSISREKSNDHAAAVEVLRGIQRIANMSDEPTRKRLETTIKSFVVSDTFYDVFQNLKTYRDISLMNTLLNRADVPTVKPDNALHAFNAMDKVAMYNADKDFGLGLSMFSSRTKNYEGMNKENRKGWYSGDGMLYLYNNDLSHYSNDYWATVNPYRLPGTTELTTARDNDSGQVVLPSAFVGTSKLDEQNGTSAMDFTNWNNVLQVHKGWFMLKDKIVALGSQIKNQSTDEVITTIEQRKVDAKVPYKVYVNDKEEALTDDEKEYKETETVFLESSDTNRNIGYVFFKKADLIMSQALRKGKWKDINDAQSDEEKENTFITMYQKHVKDNDEYAYMIVPNVDRDTFKKLVDAMKNSVLQNDDTLQVVYDPTQNVWGIIKYDDEPSTIDGKFQVLKRGIYTIKKEDSDYAVSYLNPEKQETDKKENVFKVLETDTEKPEESKPTPDMTTTTSMTLPITTQTRKHVSLGVPYVLEKHADNRLFSVVFKERVDADMLHVEKVENPVIAEKLKPKHAMVYDIYLTKNGQKVEIKDNRIVAIELYKNEKNPVLYHVLSNGQLEKIEAKVENGKLVFETNHFSHFVLAVDAGVSKSLPYTGTQETHIFTYVGVLFGGMAIFAYNKRKSE
ncbi:LPXTG cell wall anchor domain-containing protein [Carnobacteriaceae bacterium zg-84]|uniref:polysaccharide lyase family 8 super-sandwich domain-containing protein n=1 Tax=Granulicatella sp. zg-84 TaxID=2678503 RepID=UPI0013BF895E|nr:polysaccharide lyase family 8 super-sandwich domain-containing protein [Granulicatella sp. zg-84]NEW66507.1 LPXTG cell wall anchor domain-containing protein [Granulicatella sp. zg-84]QMI85505.1 LPXTG cell wall anchor domain-containing protein [Carnobacteriaceae bacterium zg-84]